jgi:hypothetical protein
MAPEPWVVFRFVTTGDCAGVVCGSLAGCSFGALCFTPGTGQPLCYALWTTTTHEAEVRVCTSGVSSTHATAITCKSAHTQAHLPHTHINTHSICGMILCWYTPSASVKESNTQHTHTQTHRCRHTHMHTHTQHYRTCTHARTHTHTHTHTRRVLPHPHTRRMMKLCWRVPSVSEQHENAIKTRTTFFVGHV